MTPVVSAADDDVGVIWTIESSGTEVWSPGTRRIDGDRLFTPAPLQSVIWTFTGSTWPFFSLFVTGVLVTGGRNAPEPTTTGSLNVPLKTTGAVKTSGPARPVVVPVKAEIVGGTFETVTLKVAWPEPPSLSVTFTVTVYVVGAPSL